MFWKIGENITNRQYSMIGIFYAKIVNMRSALMNRKDTTRFFSELLICSRYTQKKNRLKKANLNMHL